MDKRKGNVTLCLVPGHAENEVADEEAKRALKESNANDKKYAPEDLTVREKWRAADKECGKRGRMQ
jgi:hypothetical protein